MVPTPLTVVSTGLVFVFVVLLVRYESKRKRRFFHVARAHVDFWFLKLRHMFNVRLRMWGRYFIRQIGHYFLHTMLTGAIKVLRGLEVSLGTLLRSNKSLAKKSDKERSEMNTLEEIALHKMEVALTEEEKRIRKKQSLEG